jgi:hypothetical protein
VERTNSFYIVPSIVEDQIYSFFVVIFIVEERIHSIFFVLSIFEERIVFRFVKENKVSVNPREVYILNKNFTR